MHGPRQPAWEVYAESGIDFIARHSFIFQSGIPKMDVAFYMYITTFPDIVRNYLPKDLEEVGYAYEYISPNNFDLPQAYVSNGVLAPDAQEFKALVVRANDSMTVQGAQGISTFANAGLPIIFSGGIPTYLASYNTSGAEYVSRALNNLTSLPNVHVVPYEGLADTIASLGITPLTKVSANNTWYTYWRHTDDYNYVFVYNDADAASTTGLGNGYSAGTVEFATIGTPYFLDAWSGEEVPIFNYTQTSDSTTIPFQLAGNQSVIVAFALSGNSSTQSSNSSGTPYNVADPSQYYPPSSANTPIDLTSWDLIVEHWDPPANLSDMVPSATVKYNTTHQLPSGLLSWQEIPGLQNTSGHGFYNTTFNWPASSAADGAIIDFGAIVHTLQVSINSFVLPPVDATWAKRDISNYVVPGENVVEAMVTTTLFNVIRPIWGELMSGANGTSVPPNGPQDYGLISPVKVIRYSRS